MGFNKWTMFFATMSVGLSIAVIALAISLSNVSPSSADSGNTTTTNSTTTATTTMEPTTTSQEPWEREYRLPVDTIPVNYDINLHPDFETGHYSGRVDIHLTTTAVRKFFLVHIKFLEITSTSVTVGHDSNGEAVKLLDAFEYAPNEFWVVPLVDGTPAGNYTLSLVFTGSLTRDIIGFYRSVYYNSDTNVSR